MFDYYGPDEFKYAVLDVTNDQIVIPVVIEIAERKLAE